MAFPDIRLGLRIPRAPADIRAWWLDLPPDYRAADPREQPYRVRTLVDTGRERVLMTYWRGPFGHLAFPEVLRLREDGTWSFDATAPWGVDIHDEFRLEQVPGGTLVRIESTLSPRHLGGRILLALAGAPLRRWMRRIWQDAAALCERDAPRLARPAA